jgi:hypothetical protein
MMDEGMHCSIDLSILLLVLPIVSERLSINGNNFGGSIPEEFSSWQFLRKYCSVIVSWKARTLIAYDIMLYI